MHIPPWYWFRTVTLSPATKEPIHDTIDLPLTNSGTIPLK